MKYLSVCSGIEAASCAWRDLGWQAAAYSEIEPFPCAVLLHHFPDTPNWGDMTKWKDWPDETIDLLVGGTPCQSFSTAGLRKGLDDIRGQLAIGFSAIAERYRPRWIVWENVPGVLSSGGGRDFAAFLEPLVKFGYGLCWRVLDAQHFGVPQRRRRVFVIGYLGNWRHSAAVLFEPESLCGNSKKGRKKGEGTTRNAGFGAATSGSYWDGGQLSQTLDAVLAKGQTMPEKNRFPAVLVRQWPSKTASTLSASFGSKLGLENQHINEGAPLFVLSQLGAKNPTAVAFHATRRDGGRILGDLSPTVEAHWGTGGGNVPNVSQSMQVRRLTPRECERLQGFPDDWTNVSRNGKPAPDGPRYKAIGNSMAVPVMRWIGQRIQMVENVANG
jgi:DNA (cytosine-5)-methyltransferase 1